MSKHQKNSTEGHSANNVARTPQKRPRHKSQGDRGTIEIDVE